MASVLALALGVLAALALVVAGTASASAQSRSGGTKPVPPHRPGSPTSDQVIAGYPLTITVEDDTQMQIQYTNSALGQNETQQFFGQDAEGTYLWVNVGGTTKVFGPAYVPAGRNVNPYNLVSNVKTGVGSPSNPFVVTTIATVPGTNLRLTQRSSYVNGAEFVGLSFQLEQIGGSTPMTATLFHAADLFTGNSDQGYGYYDSSNGGVGDYYTVTTGVTLYQEFVPNAGTPASAYKESYYGTIWGNIGDTTGPGDGFDNTIISATLHDSGAGLQWNLTVPPAGSITVGDTDLFSPHGSLCGSFSDVPYGSFYYDYIYYLACNGIVSGYSDTTFRPAANTTRGQLTKIASNAAGFNEPVSGQLFTDVPPTNPFYVYIQRMATRGLISGYDCGGPGEVCDPQRRPYFRWANQVTRGQLAKIVANAKGLGGTPTGQTFNDVPPSSPFYLYVERLAALGTISGYSCGGPGEPCPGNYFRVGNNATRGQTSKIVKLTFFP